MYSALYLRSNTDYISSLLYIGIYFMRRFIFVAAIILLDNYFTFSLILITINNLGILAYLMGIRPFIETQDLVIEIVNELLTYAIGMCFLCMGFHHENPEIPIEIGWVAIMLSFAVFAINWLFIVYVIIKNIIIKLSKKTKQTIIRQPDPIFIHSEAPL